MNEEPRIIIRTIHGDIDLGFIQEALPKLMGMGAESIRELATASPVQAELAARFLAITDPVGWPDADAKTVAAILMFLGLGFASSAMFVAKTFGQEIHMHVSKEPMTNAAMPIVAPGTPTGGNC